MLALTLWRPWDTAILHLGKPVENRDWPPPASMVGQRFALHSGKKWDKDGAASVADLSGRSLVELAPFFHRAMDVHSAVIGTVRLSRVIKPNTLPAMDPLASSPWYFGSYGWVCDDPFPLPKPVPCRGAQRLWRLPPDVEARVLEQEAER